MRQDRQRYAHATISPETSSGNGGGVERETTESETATIGHALARSLNSYEWSDFADGNAPFAHSIEKWGAYNCPKKSTFQTQFR